MATRTSCSQKHRRKSIDIFMMHRHRLSETKLAIDQMTGSEIEIAAKTQAKNAVKTGASAAEICKFSVADYRVEFPARKESS